MAKMNKKWVALCSTAIGAIYAAGYFATETQATIQQPQQQVQVTQTKSSQINRLYKEGTYMGTGSNRRGSIQVAVTIKSDKITDVEISHFAMHYTIDDVVGLPQEVVQKQSAQVRNVSGATYSTQAFKDAVQDALSQARNS
ncbi:FMN-binding protein [Paenibacillus sp. LMG 31458]|uniref:FMN-binding protein n=1 Tax=Paenibacillus phytorum TaxID=2654977 RepID=A0ABX1Y0U6_9BACL|nr:FMN-binding protein [Paenibacillus phytorum]NOU73685.1 FMN-binding protein [Paenibacillus phytorum]